MKVLVVADAYPPEIRSASDLMSELAEELNARGHQVSVLTSYPAYNLAHDSLGKHFDECMNEGGITVIRVRTLPHHKVNYLVRGVAQITMPYLFLRTLQKYQKGRFDIVLVYSPPLTLAKIGRVLKRSQKSRFILNVQDIFPQNAIDLGALNNPAIIAFFEKMEKKAYDSADVIAVHSEGNRRFLIANKKIQDTEKLRVLHNWIDVDSISSSTHETDYRKRYGLVGKFIYLFAGVVGPSQGLDIIIDIAQQAAVHKDIVFLIVGDGMERQRLEKQTVSKGLKNVVFRPFIPKKEYVSLVRSVDVGIVSLTSKNKTPVVPGKILGYMAGSKPVLAFLNKESDGNDLIKTARCGVSELSDSSVDRLVEVTLDLYRRRTELEQIGKNGHDYVAKMFSKKMCIDKLETFFSD
ncbi:MAG TPA: glycosyltransferase WbuB [bacterium]|nr:glycosyltransferase WbuB [bacterium]